MRIVEPSFTILDELEQRSPALRIEYCGRVCYKSEERMDADSAAPFVRKMLRNRHSSVLEMAVLTLEIRCADAAPIGAFLARLPRFFHIDQINDGDPGLLLTGSIRAFRELWQNCPDDILCRALFGFLLARYPLFFEDLAEGEAPPAPEPGIRVRKLGLAEVDRLPPELLARHRFLAVRFVVNRAVSHEMVRHRPCSFLQESQRYCRYDRERFGGEVAFIRPLFFPEGSEEFTLWRESMAAAEQASLRLLETASPQAARTVLPNSCKTEIIVHANLAQWRHILRLRTSPAADPAMREVMIPLQAEVSRRWPGIFGGETQIGEH